MNVLFVPAQSVVLPHGFPLLALAKGLDASQIRSAFLLPQAFHELFRQAGANVLDLDHVGVPTEMTAYNQFKPDVVVDDLSASTALIGTLSSRVPRVTIMRTGSFPGEGKQHSSTYLPVMRKVYGEMGLDSPEEMSDLVLAEAFIVPGVPSVEALPASVENREDYFYSGPLVLPDMPPVALVPWSDKAFEAAEKFLTRHAGRRVALVTFGTVAAPPRVMQAAIAGLLRQGLAVLSSVPGEAPDGCEDLFFHAPFLPFHRICSQAALMIHHCGSGTYQYPLLHGVPAVTVATGDCDRDGIGERLNSLGASVHLAYDEDDALFLAQFESAVADLLNKDSDRSRRCRRVLAELKSEMEQTSARFSLDKLLRDVHARHAQASLVEG